MSSLYTGGISDKEIPRCSGILKLIDPGDSVMADKGLDISHELLVCGCKLNIPPFVKSGHLSKTEITKTRKIALLCIHVEEPLVVSNDILSCVIP